MVLEEAAPSEEKLSNVREAAVENASDKELVSKVWASTLQALHESRDFMKSKVLDSLPSNALANTRKYYTNNSASFFNTSSLHSHATRLSGHLQEFSQHLSFLSVVEAMVWVVLALFLVPGRGFQEEKDGETLRK